MITIYFDGACGPSNPGGRCGGGAIITDGKDLFHEIAERYHPKEIGQTSNNVGEYFGLLKALEYLYAKGLNNEKIEVFGDSNMVINQMSGHWKIKVKKPTIYTDIGLKTIQFKNLFPNISFTWIPRENNTVADELSKKAINN